MKCWTTTSPGFELSCSLILNWGSSVPPCDHLAELEARTRRCDCHPHCDQRDKNEHGQRECLAGTDVFHGFSPLVKGLAPPRGTRAQRRRGSVGAPHVAPHEPPRVPRGRRRRRSRSRLLGRRSSSRTGRGSFLRVNSSAAERARLSQAARSPAPTSSQVCLDDVARHTSRLGGRPMFGNVRTSELCVSGTCRYRDFGRNAPSRAPWKRVKMATAPAPASTRGGGWAWRTLRQALFRTGSCQDLLRRYPSCAPRSERNDDSHEVIGALVSDDVDGEALVDETRSSRNL